MLRVARYAGELVVSGIQETPDGTDFVLPSDDERSPLMQFGWDDVQNPDFPIGRFTTGLLNDHCQRRCFVQQPQFSFRLLNRAGVQKDAAVQEGPVYIGD